MPDAPNIAILCAHARPLGVSYFHRKRRPDALPVCGRSRPKQGFFPTGCTPILGALGRCEALSALS